MVVHTLLAHVLVVRTMWADNLKAPNPNLLAHTAGLLFLLTLRKFTVGFTLFQLAFWWLTLYLPSFCWLLILCWLTFTSDSHSETEGEC